MSDVLAALQPIFRDVLDRPNIILDRRSSGENVEGWDSLAHINLVAAVEHHFKVRFALGELQTLKNVGDMVDLIVEKRKR